MTAYGRWIGVALTAAALTALATLAPAVFRHMDAFRVRTVEVSGSKYMSPEAALAASGITDSASVFDDTGDWAERLRSERLIADANVRRRLPATLRIELVEALPVALVRTPELRPVDARGRLLPIDVAGQDIDVPVIMPSAEFGADSTADESTRHLIDALLQILAYDEHLGSAVSEIGRATGGGLRLVLRDPAHSELLLPDPPADRTMQQVLLAFDHLRSEGDESGTATTALDRLSRIDARYADELFVTLRSRRTK